MPSSSASCWPRSVETARFSSQSHLLPIRILFTPSVACCSTLENQVRMSVGGAKNGGQLVPVSLYLLPLLPGALVLHGFFSHTYDSAIFR